MSSLKLSCGASKTKLDRRGFLRLMFWAGLIGYSSKPAFAAIDYVVPEKKFFSLYNPSTKENSGI